ncbi:MAG: UDP-3-O-[3-hydroxymyristoyl] N-acetylglucosamine deacetylase [Deltaproteobacteria bacterium]|nr:UDP-3-O-[3-hydroxymyristoyl] N-acetylglucosamine deacetylase [Deltaproteobacteria bacterium]
MSNHYPIYVVDDEQSICDSLRGIFSDEGYNIVTCPDAKTLFEKAAELPPALVLLDIWLPDIDGLEVLTKLRQNYPDTAVIMMSGHAGITSAVTAIKKGASDFLEKPLNMDVLLEKVSNALKTHGEKDVQIHLPFNRERIRHKKGSAGIASLIESDTPQKTLKGNIVLNGTGLMSGRNTGVILSPLGENMGIIFETLDGERIPAHLTSLENYLSGRDSQNFTANSTVLISNGSRIRTVEHLMATLHMFEINNALIKVDEEIPNVDGSAEDFCKLIEETGTVNQGALSKKIVINERFIIGTEKETEKYICAEPYNGFEVSMRINYAAPIFEQTFTFNKKQHSFATEIAPARSFNTFENIGMAQKMGKVGGGYLDSHIIIHDGEVINTTLRYPDEFVRHKILDIVGDLYLLGYPLQGKITANMTSHGFNHAFAQKIYDAFR